MQNKVKEFMKNSNQKFYHYPHQNLEQKALRVALMEEEMKEYEEATTIVDIADALTDQLYVLLGTFITHGLHNKIEELFEEVHRSNMSKFYLTKPDEEEMAYLETKNLSHIELVGECYVAKDKNGKTIKPSYYSPANLVRICS